MCCRSTVAHLSLDNGREQLVLARSTTCLLTKGRRIPIRDGAQLSQIRHDPCRPIVSRCTAANQNFAQATQSFYSRLSWVREGPSFSHPELPWPYPRKASRRNQGRTRATVR